MKRIKTLISLTAAMVLAPALASAHPAGTAVNNWMDGLNHPLMGWDHLVVMVSVGLWASQQAGRARWAIPAAFIAAMALGGLVGAAGIAAPFAEPMILLSVVAIAALALLRVRMPTWMGASIVSLFAVFHGHAHGYEMPHAASAAAYGAGLLVSTALLHLLGYLAGQVPIATLRFRLKKSRASEAKLSAAFTHVQDIARRLARRPGPMSAIASLTRGRAKSRKALNLIGMKPCRL